MCTSREYKCCCLFTILTSLIVAGAIAAVFFAGIIPSIPVLLYITLIVGLAGLLYLEISYYCSEKKYCTYPVDKCLIASLVGSVITSLFALTVTSLATGSIPVAILIGAVAFFLVSTIINILIRLFQMF